MKRYTLSRKERIKSKKLFDTIYSQNNLIVSKDQKVKAVFIIENQTENIPVKVTEAVSKKTGNAVWRNRVKRLLRESYRVNKFLLVDKCLERNISLAVVFSPYFLNQKRNPILQLSDVLPGMLDVINKIRSSI
ncbi:MAG: ribonuclease P protein component [Ignavibacteria bacterium]|nr:ribonuclease P protein component [Ignavibacteria bacterium]MDP3831523.1 ribonuclease P protein component [Ignavibacteriaceae bacterium]